MISGSGHEIILYGLRSKQVAQWQSERLKGTHADLYSQARYHAGLDFLLQDLYSPGDFYQRDDDIDRIFPKLIKLMPDSILDLVSSLVELDHLTQKWINSWPKFSPGRCRLRNYRNSLPESLSTERQPQGAPASNPVDCQYRR